MAVDRYDREGLRKVLREINLDDYKTSDGMKSAIDEGKKKGTPYKNGMVTEDELIDVIQYLRAPSGASGKSRMDYMCEHQKGTYELNKGGRQMAGSLNEAWMEEKRKAEQEEYGNRFRGTTGLPQNVRESFAETTPQESKKRSIEDIKAAYIREMDNLTKKFQEEINGLQ